MSYFLRATRSVYGGSRQVNSALNPASPGRQLIVEREVSVFGGPLVEVFIGALFVDAAGNQVGGPVAVATAPVPTGFALMFTSAFTNSPPGRSAWKMCSYRARLRAIAEI